MTRGRAIALAAAAGAASGCVERRIYIDSDPPGARVFVNDADVGVTPVELDFTYFGTYDVRLHKPGYEPLVTTAEAEAPLHEVPVIDLFALLVPVTKRTEIFWDFELEPARSDPQALAERAAEVRAMLDPPAEAPAETGGEPGVAEPDGP